MIKVSKISRLTLVLVSAAAILFLVVVFVLPPLTRQLLRRIALNYCSQCTVDIDSLSLSLVSPGRFSIYGIAIKGGPPHAGEYTVNVESISGNLHLLELLNRKVVLSNVVLDRSVLHFVDGAKRAANDKDTGEPKDDFALRVSDVSISDGRLEYVRKYKGTTAVMNVSNINGKVLKLGNAPEFSHEAVEADINFQVQDSGKAKLRLETTRSDNPKLSLVLDVDDQSLPALSRFFRPNAGVDLKGRIINGRADVKLKNQALTADVRVTYEKLEVDLLEHPDRSAILASVESFGSGLVYREDDLELPEEERSARVERIRKPGEKILPFILEAMRDGAFEVAERV